MLHAPSEKILMPTEVQNVFQSAADCLNDVMTKTKGHENEHHIYKVPVAFDRREYVCRQDACRQLAMPNTTSASPFYALRGQILRLADCTTNLPKAVHSNTLQN
jgi:hypothetical protein